MISPLFSKNNAGLACLRSSKVVVIGTLLYAAPKAISVLCSHPEHPTDGQIGRLREKMVFFKEGLRAILGEKTWFVLTKIIADNSWISFIALSYLTQGAPLFTNLNRGLDEASAFFGLCSVAWLVRFGISNFVLSHHLSNEPRD